jgi:hypothetical protein
MERESVRICTFSNTNVTSLVISGLSFIFNAVALRITSSHYKATCQVFGCYLESPWNWILNAALWHGTHVALFAAGLLMVLVGLWQAVKRPMSHLKIVAH